MGLFGKKNRRREVTTVEPDVAKRLEEVADRLEQVVDELNAKIDAIRQEENA